MTEFANAEEKAKHYSRNISCVVDTSSSPSARLRALPLDAVRWTGGFWADRYRQTRDRTVRVLWELLADPDAGHVLDNFRIAAGRQPGEHQGTDWQDAWLYKWIEAAACLFRGTGDAWLDERMDESVELIAAAQQPDGYVATQMTIPGEERFQDPRNHEVYSMGHLLTAAVVHSRMTGKDTFIKIAVRVGDFLCSVLGLTVDPGFAHNPSAVMGLVELYRETAEKKYLDCAQLIVDQRGHDPRPGWLFNQTTGVLGTDQIQDRVPIRREQEVVGHNVFFTYLFAGAADVCLETGEETLREALERLWVDLVGRKINVNGGVSPMGTGLSRSRDPVCEAVGPAYFLPNTDAYNETCGQIGNLMWNYRMLCHEPKAEYADTMELEIYNSILSGIGLEGDCWWYRNALRRHETEQGSSAHNDLAAREKPGRRRICCPTNLLRTVAQWQNYAYSVSSDGIWVHHYGANEVRLALPSEEVGLNPPAGERAGCPEALIRVEQVTHYPWDGKIVLNVKEAPARDFTLRLRVPAWAEGVELKINGETVSDVPAPGTYAAITCRWRPGDVVELDLPMPVRLVHAHPRVEQCRNQVAIFRGPILYCLESPDLPEEVSLWDVSVPSDAALAAVEADDLSFGAVVLEGELLHCPSPPWTNTELYRPLATPVLAPLRVRMIPYFAWANRGPSAMSVWLPLVLRNCHDQ